MTCWCKAAQRRLIGLRNGQYGALDQADTGGFSCKESTDIRSFVMGFGPDDMNDALVGVARLGLCEKLGGIDPINGRGLDKRRIESAMDPVTIPFGSGCIAALADLHWDSFARIGNSSIYAHGLHHGVGVDALIIVGDWGPRRRGRRRSWR